MKKLPQLPSIVWVLIFAGGLVAFIGTIITFFILLGTVPGFASAIFLVIGLLYVFFPNASFGDSKVDPIARAIGVGFFALMGMAVDQPGNLIYNYPLRFFCPAESVLNRRVDVSHPLPGRTDLTQDFSCLDGSDNVVYRIGIGPIIATRFVEYLVLAYVFIGLKNLRGALRVYGDHIARKE